MNELNEWELLQEWKILKKRQARMELEVEEATQEDYDRVYNKIEEIENSSEIKKILEEIKKFDKKLNLRYRRPEFEESILCEFDINLIEGTEEIIKKIFEIRDFTNKKAFLRGAKCELQKNGNDFRLIISGRGHDGRCRWCRTFRTTLAKSLFDLKVDVSQNQFCRFDKGGHRDI